MTELSKPDYECFEPLSPSKEEALSECCDAPITDYGFCSKCKEHATPYNEEHAKRMQDEEVVEVK